MSEKQQSERLGRHETYTDRFATKARLNLNDLLRRRKEEKKVDKKANIFIFSGVGLVAVVVILILSF